MKSYLDHRLNLLVGLVVLVSVTSCDCNCSNIPKTPNSQSEGLAMEVSPTTLMGPEKTIEATFSLADSKKSANLTKYQVRITLTETGGTGSSLSYIDGTKANKVITNSLQETVGHFFSTTVLKINESSLKVPFTLVSGPHVTAIAIQFELLDKQGEILQAHTTHWDKGTVQLRIIKLMYGPIPNMVTYKIQNSGQGVADNVQLRYTNISEDDAGKTILLNDKQANILSLGEMAGGSSTEDKSLVLDFKAATQATFKFEVLCQGALVAEATKEQNFSIKLPRLKITPIGPTFLVGNNYTISFKLEQEDPSEAIELDKLSLRINDLMVGDPRIATNNHNPARILEDMGRINIRLNQTISLTIQPGGVNKAAFSMHLFYGGIPLGPKQTFTWTADRAAKPTLCDAAEIDDINLLKQLLAVPGVQVNATNEGGDTALHIYAQKYNPEAIRLLIDNGADVNLVKNSTYAPWYTAPLNIAARYSNQAVINQILQVPGVNVNFKDSSGRTPLHSLVGSSTNQATVESMKQLIAKGADVNAINMWGATPLHNAVSHPTRSAFVEELLKAPGIHIDAKDHDGNTPLHLAVEEESVAIIKLLLDKGAQQDIRNKKGKTALDLAATSVDEEIKKLFNI